MLTIKKSKQQVKIVFASAIFFSTVGVLLILLHYFGVGTEKFSLLSVSFAQLFIGAVNFLSYLFVRTYPFIKVDESYLFKGYLWKDKILLQELTEVKIFAGELVLKTTSKEVRIDKNLIEEKDFDTLYDLLTQKVTSK